MKLPIAENRHRQRADRGRYNTDQNDTLPALVHKLLL